MHFLAVTPLPPILQLERPLHSKHFERGTHLICWVHQGILWNLLHQATSFIFACYGQTNCSTMSEIRLKAWLSERGKGLSTPKLCTLPPTTEVFKENVKRAHRQALVWQSLEAQNPPELDSTEYGWVKDDQNKSLQPVTLPD